jgi:Phosphoesterase family
VPAFDHVFFVFMENENYGSAEAPANHGDYIVDNPAAPYLNGAIAYNGSLLSQFYATTHPSDPNYLAVTGGTTFGMTTNPTVADESQMIRGTNLGDELEAAGKTWKAYAEGMAYPCDPTSHDTPSGGYYLPDDEPFMLYADVIENQDRCEAHNQPLSQLGVDLGTVGTTPNFVWFAANDVNDMESGGVRTGDTWLSQIVPEILSSPAWMTQRSLLVISWDEGHTQAFGPDYPNHVATYVLGSQGLVKDDYVSQLRYTDFSLVGTIEDALGIGPMTSNDEYAQPLSDIWTSSGTGGGTPPGSEAGYLVKSVPAWSAGSGHVPPARSARS